MENCSQCGNEFKPDGIGTGYGVDPQTKKKICYTCCGINDLNKLKNSKIGDRFCYYLSKGKVINWPNTMIIEPYYFRVGRHNIAGRRTDVWFNVDGNKFWGVNYGDNSEILHIKRIKNN